MVPYAREAGACETVHINGDTGQVARARAAWTHRSGYRSFFPRRQSHQCMKLVMHSISCRNGGLAPSFYNWRAALSTSTIFNRSTYLSPQEASVACLVGDQLLLSKCGPYGILFMNVSVVTAVAMTMFSMSFVPRGLIFMYIMYVCLLI
jgi:hypothetical protein